MKSLFTLSLSFLLFSFLNACVGQAPSKEAQIKSAVLSAPEDLREGAKIMGFNEEGELITLREGNNQMICLADDPNKDNFNSACYHKSLEPFMSRGRELRAEGKTTKEIFDIREQEVQAGTLKMPENPTTLHIFSGLSDIFNTETGEVTGGNYRAVVYIPYATAESSGLPLKPEVDGGPWLMDPGTHRAHIMITPPKN